MEAAILDFKKKLASLDLQDEPLCQSQAAAYRATCQTRVGQLNAILKPAKEDVKKVDKSPNKAAFQSSWSN